MQCLFNKVVKTVEYVYNTSAWLINAFSIKKALGKWLCILVLEKQKSVLVKWQHLLICIQLHSWLYKNCSECQKMFIFTIKMAQNGPSALIQYLKFYKKCSYKSCRLCSSNCHNYTGCLQKACSSLTKTRFFPQKPLFSFFKHYV